MAPALVPTPDPPIIRVEVNRKSISEAPSPASSSTPQVSLIGKRRNGLRPACEPCRKAKVRCDTSPPGSLCSRCKKRRTVPACIFLDAPMTRPPRKSSNEPTFLPTPKSPSRSTPSHCGEAPTDPTDHEPLCVTRITGAASGMMGLTSFSATLREHGGEDSDSEEDPPYDVSRDPAKIAMGLKVFKTLPSYRDCKLMMGLYIENHGEVGFPKHTVARILESCFATYQAQLEEPRSDYLLKQACSDITRISAPNLVLPDDAAGWEAGFSGVNTRWESIGIMLCGLAAGLLNVEEKSFSSLDLAALHSDRRKAMLCLNEAIECCIELCRHTLSTIVCTLLAKAFQLDAAIHGDTSLSAWRKHHDLVAVASAIGLHSYTEPAQATFRSEMRKRLSACCFWNDKDISMFTGRPPAWSHRYHSCPLNLDVSDDALIEGGDRLQQEIDSLDENGWNTKGKVHAATRARSMAISAVLLDEIMEIFIGTRDQFSMDRVRSLKVKAQQVFTQIPGIMELTKETLLRCETDLSMWSIMFIRMEYLRIHFHLERLSSERGNESKQRLVDVAREIMDMVLLVWMERDRRSPKTTHDYDYVIMCYGMPSSGILCTELLKQVKQPNNIDVDMPCSDVVQNLSLMIGFLEWIRPTAGNYKVCRRMAEVIRRVLKKVFEPALPTAKETASHSLVDQPQNGEDFLSFDDDFDWLNSIDWGRGPYMDMMEMN